MTEASTTTAFGDVPRSPASPAWPDRGAVIGRYVVTEQIGRGGMGGVYAAWDPNLARRVALKVLHRSRSEDAEQWILREAKAMAKLRHPHVVQVYELVEHDDTQLIAMELIEGDPLSEWQSAQPRSRRETIRLYLQAGEALSAAHEAGLIHGDFKPGNVMVDTRLGLPHACVLDFGLARWLEKPSTIADEARTRPGIDRSIDQRRAGTPAFMAPEQFSDRPITPATDQFSFCVSLWSALCGERPFDRDVVASMLAPGADVSAVAPPSPRGERELPAKIRDLLIRGLSPEPQDRHPSMRDLLDALRPHVEPRVRPWVWLATGALVLGSGSLVVYTSTRPRLEKCARAHEQLGEAWGQVRRDAVRSAMTASDASYASEAWRSASSTLDAYAEEWIQMHTDTCEATVVHGDQSQVAMDLRMGCLDDARRGLWATTKQLTSADAQVVQRTADLLARLPVLSRCADLEALREGTDPPKAHEAEAVDEIRSLLFETDAALVAGLHSDAAAALTRAKTRAAEIDYGPVHTEIALAEGGLRREQGEYAQAEAALRDALGRAVVWRQWDELQSAAVSLMFLVGKHQARPDEGLRYRELAEHGTKGDPHREAHFHLHLAAILAAKDEVSEAEAQLRRAIELGSIAAGPQSPVVAKARSNLGITLAMQGKFDEAEAFHREVLADRERELGDGHPLVANSRHSLALVLIDQGDYREAKHHLRRVLAARRDIYGATHPSVGIVHNSLANAAMAEGDYPQAESEYREAVEILRARLGDEHTETVQTRSNLAYAMLRQNKLDEAEVLARDGLEVQLQALGPEHRDTVQARALIAAILRRRGAYEEAIAEYRTIVELTSQAVGPAHPEVARSRHDLGLALLEHEMYFEALKEFRAAHAAFAAAYGPDRANHPDLLNLLAIMAEAALGNDDVDQAVQFATKAWEGQSRNRDIGPEDRGTIMFVLARAQWRSSRDERPRARQLATQALDLYVQAGHDHNAATVRKWLEDHG